MYVTRPLIQLHPQLAKEFADACKENIISRRPLLGSFVRLDDYIFEVGTSYDAFWDFYEVDEIESPKILQLRAALNNLSQTDKDLLILRNQNYTYKEITKIMEGKTEEALRIRYMRAIEKLKLEFVSQYFQHISCEQL